MASNYLYKGIDIENIFASTYKILDNEANVATFTQPNMYLPSNYTTKFLTSGILSSYFNIYGSIKPKANSYYKLNYTDRTFVGKGSCPISNRDLNIPFMLDETSLPGFGLGQNFVGGMVMQYLWQTTRYTHIRFTANIGIQVSIDATNWTTVPDSKMSSHVIIDLVGGGGGGGGSDLYSSWASDYGCAGSGGGGGALYSVLIDLSRSGPLTLERGPGGAGGAGDGSSSNYATRGFYSAIFKGLGASEDTMLCQAYGGEPGRQGTNTNTPVSGGSEVVTTSSMQPLWENPGLGNDSNGKSFIDCVGWGYGQKGGVGTYSTSSKSLAGGSGTMYSSEDALFNGLETPLYIKTAGGGGAVSNNLSTSVGGYAFSVSGGGGGASGYGDGGYGMPGTCSYSATAGAWVMDDSLYLPEPGAGGGGGGACGIYLKDGNDKKNLYLKCSSGQAGGTGVVCVYFEKTPYVYDVEN